MTDSDLLTLCVIQEAANQPMDGQAAIARVVLNRTRMRYSSDGTISSTILWPSQFSWVEFEMVGRVYERVARGNAEVQARVAQLLAEAKKDRIWAGCAAIAGEVVHGAYKGPLYDKLTPNTVLYDNLALACPAWVATARRVAIIGAHTFFEDPARLSQPVAPNSQVLGGYRSQTVAAQGKEGGAQPSRKSGSNTVEVDL